MSHWEPTRYTTKAHAFIYLLLRSVIQCQNKYIAVNQNSDYVLLRGGLPGAKENKSIPFNSFDYYFGR